MMMWLLVGEGWLCTEKGKKGKKRKGKKKWDEGRVARPLYKGQVVSCWSDMLEFMSQAHGKGREIERVKGGGENKEAVW